MEFVETPSFWCPHVDRAACTNFSTRTVELRPSERREILHFSFSSFLSFSFFFVSSSTNSFSFLSFLIFFIPFSHFIFSSFLLLISPPFSLLLFSFPFFFFLSSSTNSFCSFWNFLLPFGSSLIKWSREKASFPFPHATCVVHVFPSLFISFLISFIASSFMWLIVSFLDLG